MEEENLLSTTDCWVPCPSFQHLMHPKLHEKLNMTIFNGTRRAKNPPQTSTNRANIFQCPLLLPQYSQILLIVEGHTPVHRFVIVSGHPEQYVCKDMQGGCFQRQSIPERIPKVLLGLSRPTQESKTDGKLRFVRPSSFW